MFEVLKIPTTFIVFKQTPIIGLSPQNHPGALWSMNFKEQMPCEVSVKHVRIEVGEALWIEGLQK